MLFSFYLHLILQEEILELYPDNEEKQHVRQRLLLPVDLIELCLTSQNRELSLRAFDVFAYTSSSFLKCNTSVLEECWRNAANQDDWERLYQTSIAEGWSDEETLQTLRETILFQASSRCYGPEAENYEGGFDEVLPLRQENLEPPTSKDMVSSVEAIVMQHKDFAVAGKLMLTAIMLGSFIRSMQEWKKVLHLWGDGKIHSDAFCQTSLVTFVRLECLLARKSSWRSNMVMVNNTRELPS